MSQHQLHPVRTHDLLRVDAQQFLAAQPSAPEWAGENLRRTPFVVVRRGPAEEQGIPVGVRGVKRNERWAAFCHPKLVQRFMTPPQLLRHEVPTLRADVTPALRSLHLLADRWMHLDRLWGPGGGVGFELATGIPVAKPESDLDIVIYAEKPMTAAEAKSLCESATNLPSAVDIHVETPICSFSLIEYATQNPARILLRTPFGVMLGSDPWNAAGTANAGYGFLGK
jgi:phosphoribosyl-dephospho-CoA transferase